MVNEEKLRQQYQENESRFSDVREELEKTLHRIANQFYQQFRFEIKITPPRVKGIESVIRKVKKREENADSLFEKIGEELSLILNDFLGARISCNTKEDVREVEEMLTIHPRFKLVNRQEHNKPSGYRALHLDMNYEVYWEDERILIPCEIQIKTHLQTAWGDITHDESYKTDEQMKENEWGIAYSKHIADVLDVLDEMANTIRKQRLKLVSPPSHIDENDMTINSNTLSYKINQIYSKDLLTQQEISLLLDRLNIEGFENIAQVTELLNNSEIEKQIKKFKEETLRDNQNVTPFEILNYGSLLLRDGEKRFKEIMQKDYGFVQNLCGECNLPLKNQELDFITENTDSDLEYYCVNHREEYFLNQCECGLWTKSDICKNCEAKEIEF